MANNDLSGLSLGELKELEKKVAEQMAVSERDEIQGAAKQIEAIAQSLNMSVQELIDRSGLLDTKAKRGPKPGIKGTALYRNKEDESQTWTGRGRKPKWFADYVDGGGTLDELKIAA